MKLLAPILLLFLTGCLSSLQTRDQSLSEPPPVVREEFGVALEKIKSGKVQDGIYQLDQLSEQQTQHKLSDDILYTLARAYESENNPTKATQTYAKLLDKFPKSAQIPTASLRYGKLLLQNENKKAATSAFETGLDSTFLTPDIQTQLLELQIPLLEEEGSNNFALFKAYSKANQLDKANQIIQSKLKQNQLLEIVNNEQFENMHAQTYYKLGQNYVIKNEIAKARTCYSKVHELSPTSLIGQQSLSFLEEGLTESIDSSLAHSIAVFLPLSGNKKKIGQQALLGLQLGLDLNKNPHSPVKLAIVDTQSESETLADKFQTVLREQKPMLVVGGLLKSEAEELSNLAQMARIGFISLNSNASISTQSPLNFSHPLYLDKHLFSFFESLLPNLKTKRIAALIPSDSYGTKSLEKLEAVAQSLRIELVKVETYSPEEKDFEVAVQKVLSIHTSEGREDEFRKKAYKLRKENKSSRNKTRITPSEILDPIVNFDAIFIPENYKVTAQLASSLDYYYTSKKIPILGTHLWNHPDFTKWGNNSVEGAFFYDTIPFEPIAFRNSEFFFAFRQAFEEDPTSLAVQSFDTGRWMYKTLHSPEVDSKSLAIQSLLKQSDCTSCLASIRFNPETRVLERGLTLFQIQNKTIVKFMDLDPRP